MKPDPQSEVDLDVESEASKEMKLHTCHICDEKISGRSWSFKSRRTLIKHFEDAHKEFLEKKISCICGNSFMTVNQKERHQLRCPVWKKAKPAAIVEKYGREIPVFETCVSHNANEEKNGFREFSPNDYYRILATKKEDKQKKTKKIRDAENATLRAMIAKSDRLAVIRVRFPDNHTIEVKFHPSETIQSLVNLVYSVVTHSKLPFYLYTFPEKKLTVSQNFDSAGFVPGAIVYVARGLAKGKNAAARAGPFLKEDVLSLKDLEFVPQQPDSQPATGPSVVRDRNPTDKQKFKPKRKKK